LRRLRGGVFRALDWASSARTGEIERREMLEAWFAAGSLSAPNAPISREVPPGAGAGRERRQLAGVRDCFVTVDPAARRAVVLLSHSLVFPAYRRTGLAALLRTVPVALAREALRDVGAGGRGDPPRAEMEAVEAQDRASVIRLLSYARAGFTVVPPRALPYAQPDFRELDKLGIEPVPLPFLAVVRQVGEEERMTSPASGCCAIIEHLYAVHRCHVRLEHLDPIRAWARAGLEAWPGDPIPLLRPPTRVEDVAQLAPLLRSAIVHLYPPGWRWGDLSARPEVDERALIAAWRSPGGPMSHLAAPAIPLRPPSPASRSARGSTQPCPAPAPRPARAARRLQDARTVHLYQDSRAQPRQLPGGRRRQRAARPLRPHRVCARRLQPPRPARRVALGPASTGRRATGPRSAWRRRRSGWTSWSTADAACAPAGMQPDVLTVTTGAEAVENAIKAGVHSPGQQAPRRRPAQRRGARPRPGDVRQRSARRQRAQGHQL
jgi:hypothetical protein